MGLNTSVGVFLSFLFPGLGQGLAGRPRRMAAWLIGAFVSFVSIVVTIWFVPVALLVRIASAVDAYVCLRRAPSRTHYIPAAVALFGGMAALFLARQVVTGFKIPSSSMYPSLIIGDHLMVDKLSIRWRPPARGEIVVFDQPCSHLTYIKRVVAVGGDTVEQRCGHLYINSKPVPATLVSATASYQDYDDARGSWYPREVSRYHEVLDGHAHDVFHGRGGPDDMRDFPSKDMPFAPSCRQDNFYPDRPSTNVPVGQLVVTEPAAEPCDLQLHYVVPAGTYFVLGDNRDNANDSRVWGVVPARALIGRPVGIWYSNGAEGGWGRFGSID
jgi:signal peptidase I